MSRPRPWQEPPWFCRPVHRLRFQADLAARVGKVRPVRPSRRCCGGYAIRFTLTPPGLEARMLTVEFSRGAPDTPRVTVDGPAESPHRYDDGALCMWFPGDPPERRWRRRDGAAALAGHIAGHLIREAWWRQTGEWIGDEVQHGETTDGPGSQNRSTA